MTNSILAELNELKNMLDNEKKDPKNKSRQVNNKCTNFGKLKADYSQIKINSYVEKIKKDILKLSKNIEDNNPDNDKILELIRTSQQENGIKGNIDVLIELAGKLSSNSKSESSGQNLSMPENIPPQIKSEIMADFFELEKCFNAKCYRACTIICGRIIEVCLHRKYFDVIGIDLLEKNPGIGLGKLIAKMSEKNISLDPGLPQQIHLINQVRIYSVHKKSESFYPTREQAYAMVLYTIDVIKRLF